MHILYSVIGRGFSNQIWGCLTCPGNPDTTPQSKSCTHAPWQNTHCSIHSLEWRHTNLYWEWYCKPELATHTQDPEGHTSEKLWLTAYLEKPARSDLGSTFTEKGVNGCIHMLHSSNSAVVILTYEFSLRQGDDGKSQKRSSHQPQVLLTIFLLQI